MGSMRPAFMLVIWVPMSRSRLTIKAASHIALLFAGLRQTLQSFKGTCSMDASM